MTCLVMPRMSKQADQERVVPMRLQKFLARAGAASRRGSENLMTAGRVRVNGVIVTELGSKVDPTTDVVTVDGREVRLADEAVYIILNKPAGYVTTMSDPAGRPCVASLVPKDQFPGLFPVGRLDRDTTGILLFTTDGKRRRDFSTPRSRRTSIMSHSSRAAFLVPRSTDSSVALRWMTAPARRRRSSESRPTRPL